MSLPHPQLVTTEWLDRVLSLGKLADEVDDVQAVSSALTALLQEQGNTPFSAVCASFELSDAECAALAWCLWRAVNLRPFPAVAELNDLCRAMGHPYAKPFSLLFNPAAGTLLRTACAVLLNHEPKLPPYVRLDTCPQRQVFHAEALLEECEGFLARCAEQSVPLPAALALVGRKGTGKRFLFSELARRRGCTLLIADCSLMTSEHLYELAGLAVLFNSLICLDHYDDSAQSLVSGLYDWFSVLLFSCEHTPGVPQGCNALMERSVPELTAQERAAALQALFGENIPHQELARAAAMCRVPIGVLVSAATRLRAEDCSNPD